MKILYIAYSCSPNKGSEDKVSWNICLEASKHNKVYLITKEESRSSIEGFINATPNELNAIEIFYVDIPRIYKRLFKKSLYSARLNIWHRRALPLARRIASTESVEIIHQLTPLEFRSIGKYGSIPNTKFVCGPLGGGENVPDCLHRYVKGCRCIELVRQISNTYYKYLNRINGTFKHSDYIFAANRETADYLHLNGIIMPDLGVDNRVNEIRPPHKKKSVGDEIVFLVAGRLIDRKGHLFLMDVIERIGIDLPYYVIIVGDGPEMKKLKRICCNNATLRAHVRLLGKIPYNEMNGVYQKADVLIMPSLRDTTGNVIVEALSNGLPVITIDMFGGSLIINNKIGWKYNGKSENEIKGSLKNIMLECINNPEVINQKRKNIPIELQKYTWKNKVSFYEKIYNKLIYENSIS